MHSEKQENNWSQIFVPMPCCISVTINYCEIGAFLLGYFAIPKPIGFLYARIRKYLIAAPVDPGLVVASSVKRAYSIESLPE